MSRLVRTLLLSPRLCTSLRACSSTACNHASVPTPPPRPTARRIIVPEKPKFSWPDPATLFSDNWDSSAALANVTYQPVTSPRPLRPNGPKLLREHPNADEESLWPYPKAHKRWSALNLRGFAALYWRFYKRRRIARDLMKDLDRKVFKGRMKMPDLRWSDRIDQSKPPESECGFTGQYAWGTARLSTKDSLPKDVEHIKKLRALHRISFGYYDTYAHWSLIQLKPSRCDDKERIESVLAHELAHAATQSGTHGHVWRDWAEQITRARPDINISMLDNYDRTFRYYFECTNPDFRRIIGMDKDEAVEKMDFNTTVHARCRGTLRQLVPAPYSMRGLALGFKRWLHIRRTRVTLGDDAFRRAARGRR